MADMSVKPSWIRDVVRDSKIRLDTPSMLKPRSDSLLPESYHAKAGLRHNRTHDDHRVGRDFPRISADEVSRRFNHQSYNETESSKRVDFNSKFDEGERWFHGCNGNEDPFNWFYNGYGESDSLVARFRRNLPVFDGFWHTEDLTSWIDGIEDFFDEINPPEHLKCKIVWYKMKGAAYYWWKTLQNDRFSEGKCLISSWPIMKRLLLKRFMPATCLMKDIEIEAITTESSNKDDEGSVNEQSKEELVVKPAKCSIKVSTESNTDNSHYLCLSADDACKVPKCGDVPSDASGHDTLIVDKEENAQLVASELDMKKSKSEFAVAAQFLVSAQSTGEEIPIVTETRMIISKSKLGNTSGLESIVEEGNEAFHANFMDQTLQGPPIPVAIVDRIYMILHDQGSHKHEEQREDKWPKWVNRFGGGLSSFSDDNKNMTCLLNSMCVVSLNVDTKLVLFLFDPGGYIHSSDKWGIHYVCMTCAHPLIFSYDTLLVGTSINWHTIWSKQSQLVPVSFDPGGSTYYLRKWNSVNHFPFIFCRLFVIHFGGVKTDRQYSKGRVLDIIGALLYVADIKNNLPHMLIVSVGTKEQCWALLLYFLNMVLFLQEAVGILAGNGDKRIDYQGRQIGNVLLFTFPTDACFDFMIEIVYITLVSQHQPWKHYTCSDIIRILSGDGFERDLNGTITTSTSFTLPIRNSLFYYSMEVYVTNIKTWRDVLLSENLFKYGDHDAGRFKGALRLPFDIFCGDDEQCNVAGSYTRKVQETQCLPTRFLYFPFGYIIKPLGSMFVQLLSMTQIQDLTFPFHPGEFYLHVQTVQYTGLQT